MSSAYVENFVNLMKTKFENSTVGELAFFWVFKYVKGATGIFSSQEKYARNLISKFEVDKAKAKHSPTTAHLKMSKDTSGEKLIQVCIEALQAIYSI